MKPQQTAGFFSALPLSKPNPKSNLPSSGSDLTSNFGTAHGFHRTESTAARYPLRCSHPRGPHDRQNKVAKKASVAPLQHEALLVIPGNMASASRITSGPR